MAVFPQGSTAVDQRCNTGERRVLHQLKRCLDDDYLVWHDIPIGPRARQPDFVILSPRQGLLLLEVKHWKRSTLVGGNRDRVELTTPRGRVTEPHPLRQARDYALELVDLMRRDPALVHADGPFRGKLLFPYGWGVALSGIRRADVAATDFDELFPEPRTLTADDLDDQVDAGAFQARLWALFTLSYPHTLTLPQRDRIRWHLFPEIRMPVQASFADQPAGADGGATPGATPGGFRLPDLLRVMDLQQEQVARTLGEGHRVIHGAAGSGKTMILIFRAQQLAAAARVDQPVLVLCYNRALADRIDAQLRARGVDERVLVRTFHAWCGDLVRSYQLYVPVDSRANDYYEQLAATLTRAVETGFVPGGQYSALLVDEAHDFDDAWLRAAARMVSPVTRSLLVLYDDAQSIYQKKRRRFNFASVGIEAVGRTSILKLNYRNTAEVLALAMHCARGLLLKPGEGKGDATAAGAADEGNGDAGIDAGRKAVATDADAADSESAATPDGLLVQPASAGRRGPLPVLVEAANERDEAGLMAERIAHARADGCACRDIAILARDRRQLRACEPALRRLGLPFASMASAPNRRLQRDEWAADSVKLLTLHSSKGLEFNRVFIVGLQALPQRGAALDDELRLLYVGMTRATDVLVLSAHGGSVIVDKVREAVAAVALGFRTAE